MNLNPLKALIPHWSVGLVVALIAAMGLGYFASVKRSTSHLISRNFVHLNEVSDVLDETFEVLEHVTLFAENYCVSKSLGNDAASEEVDDETRQKKDFRQCLQERLVKSSPYVTQTRQLDAAGSDSDAGVEVDRSGIAIQWSAGTDGGVHRLTIPFENVNGLSNAVPYFNSLLIADDGSGDVLFDSADSELQARAGQPESYFSDNGSYERYNTVAELIARKRALNPDSPTPKGAAFPQSTIVPVLVGGIRYLAFVQPLVSRALSDQKLYVIGMVRESIFDSDRYSIPLSTSAFCLLFLVFTLLSLSLIRIILIEENGIVGRWDLYILVGSMLGLVSLMTLVIYAGSTSSNIGRWQDEDLKQIAGNMAVRLQQEVFKKLSVLQQVEKDFHTAVYRVPAQQQPVLKSLFGESKKPGKLACQRYALLGDDAGPAIRCQTDKLPEFESLYGLDYDGRQRGLLATVRASTVVKPFSVANREYFKRVRSGDLWPIQNLRMTDMGCPASQAYCLPAFPDGEKKDVFLDRIKSRGTGQLETVLSTSADPGLCWGDGPGTTAGKCRDTARSPPIALVGITTLRSLESAVLPAGFGYVVFQNDSGKVLFHSEQDRSLLENFYDATDHDLELKTRIATALPGTLDLSYKGDNVRVNVTPMQSLPLSIVVYFKHEPLRTLIFQFCISAFMLILLYLVYQFLVLLTCEWLRVHVFARSWLKMKSPERSMWQLNLSLAVIALIYGCAVFFTDGLLLTAIVLLNPIVVYVMCRTVGAKFFSWVVSGPSQHVLDWKRDPVRAAAWAAFLLSILLAVLPSSAIFNETMDLHERGWRQFNNWWKAHALSRRTEFFSDNLSDLAVLGDPSSWDVMTDALDNRNGIYLPNVALGLGHKREQGKTCKSPPAAFDLPLFAGDPEPDWIRVSRVGICSVDALVQDNSTEPPSLDTLAILALLPDMTLMSSMLERFAEIGDSWIHKFGECRSSTIDASHCSILVDARAGVKYVVEENYPHTRSAELRFFYGLILWYLLLLITLRVVSRLFLRMVAPVQLIQEIRRQSRNQFVFMPATFYAVVPANVGEPEKNELIANIREKLKLQPAEPASLGRFLSVREIEGTDVVLLNDIQVLLSEPDSAQAVLDWVMAREKTGGLCLLVISRIDLKYLRVRQRRGDGLIIQDLEDWELLFTGLECVPFYKLISPADDNGLANHEGRAHPLYDTLHISRVGRGISRRDYFRVWQLCSLDEKMALASLVHNGVTNVSNVSSLFSLYNRGLITVAPIGLQIRDPEFRNYIRLRFPRATFQQEASGYHDDRWRIFRAPIYIGLGAVVLFVAYAAQDELTYAFRIFGGLGTALAAVSAITEKYRSLGMKS